jgi:hypothetical protein
MHAWKSARAWSAYAGVFAAALASVATSSPEWSLEDSIGELGVRLDTNAPESVQHFSVSSSQGHEVRVEGTLRWDADQSDPQAAVLVRIASDDGETEEVTYRAADSLDADGNVVDTEIAVSLDRPCAAVSCQQGYSVLFKLVDGWPSEHVDIDWSFTGKIRGGGTEEPDDAFVEVSQD